MPLIGQGDWNDGLSAVGLEFKGESVWLAHFFYLILKRFASLSEKVGRVDLQIRYNVKADELKEAINNFTWDGKWFWRATKDNGIKIGSDECEEGKIYLNAQTWSVISNSTDKERQIDAMNSVSNFFIERQWCASTRRHTQSRINLLDTLLVTHLQEEKTAVFILTPQPKQFRLCDDKRCR